MPRPVYKIVVLRAVLFSLWVYIKFEVLELILPILLQLLESRPNIFRRNLERIIFEQENSRVVANKLEEAIDYFRSGKEVDWDAIEQLGLSGSMLELKADLFYRTLGKRKPETEQPQAVLTYPESKPVWGRLFKYLKSLFGSLVQAVHNDSRFRMVLDFIKEYIECLDASVKFVQSEQL